MVAFTEAGECFTEVERQPANTFRVASAHLQAVACDIPKPAPSCEDDSFFRRCTIARSIYLKQPILRQRV